MQQDKIFKFVLCLIIMCGVCQAGEPKLNSKYILLRKVYITGVYDSLNNRVISRGTARAYLRSKEYYKKAEVGFQAEVPEGTAIMIKAKISKPWYEFFSSPGYEVMLNPDLSRGLDVEMRLKNGFEGDLDGLNPEIFKRLD